MREKERDVPRLADDKSQDRLWSEAVASADVPPDLVPVLTPDFMAAEFRAVMLGLPALAREHYLTAKRPDPHSGGRAASSSTGHDRVEPGGH